MRECSHCDGLPDELFPESLIILYADKSGITKLPLKFPPNLKNLWISWWPNLILPDNWRCPLIPQGTKVIK